MKMLDKDPNKRISVPEILTHPWLIKYRTSKRQREWGIFGKDELFEDDNDYSDDYLNEEDKTTTILS